MAETVVVADASPLIGLAAAGAFDLLRGLFGTVTVTAAVRDEALAGGALPGARELEAAIQAGWVEADPGGRSVDAFPELDPGEASTLALALEHGGECLVLMDEPTGRARAQERGIAVAGLAGVLLAAKRAGLVERIGPFFDALERSDIRISTEIVRAVLEEAGETD